jgi:Holliday junction resolvase RusA-like endonuclease
LTEDDIPENLKNYTRILNFNKIKKENKQYYDYVKNLDNPLENILECLNNDIYSDDEKSSYDEEEYIYEDEEFIIYI